MWSTVHCACYEKENSSSRFLGDVPRKSWRGGLRENCVNIMSRCCFIRLSRRSARLHVVQFKRNICSLIELLEFEVSF